MKCRYCGNNLGLEDELCPNCGKVNDKAQKYVSQIRDYREEYEETKEEVVKKKNRISSRSARIVVIAVMVLCVIVMLLMAKNYSDIDARWKRKEKRIEQEVEKNKNEIDSNLRQMEEQRDYLAIQYYMENYRLMSNEDYSEYSRVFTAVICYGTIHSDILNLVSGFKGYSMEPQDTKGWCDNIAIYIHDWNRYVGNDMQDSNMYAGEHAAFLNDIKKDTQDMVQVYFELTNDQAANMWIMEKSEIANMLYDQCADLYPEDME